MAIKPVSTSTQSGAITAGNVAADAAALAADNKQTTSTGEAAVYEKAADTSSAAKAYAKDSVTLSEISKQIETKLASLRAAVENLVSMQSIKDGEAQGLTYDQIMEKYDGKLKEFYQSLQVDDATRLKAQQEISEDGFWGVKQASERAISFAKALSGGDPSKIAMLKESIQKGYEAAEKSWGGELPEICKQTLEATMRGLDAWAGEAGQTTAGC